MTQKILAKKTLNRNELYSLIDKAADLIRTAVDYKFILVLLFLKRLNDSWKGENQKIKERLIKEAGLSEEEAEAEAQKFPHTFDIPREYFWDDITKDVKKLPENLSTAISEIAKQNKELQGVIDRVDFLEFARNQENRELLRQLVELFNKYDFNGGEVSPDILGDAYEHILMKFAPQKAKEGEIYTPREVIKLLVEILDPKPKDRVYDPCCGSGGMLIISYQHVEKKYGKDEASKLFLYGQERSPTIYAVGQMNLILHNIKNGNLENGDTLDYPRFRENNHLKQFEVVIANPPWNQDGYGEDRLKKANFRERFFDYSPNNSADWAWAQHMMASATKTGRIGLVIDNGCLFRGGREKAIRKKVIEEKDLIECVILLPEKFFYNTGAPGAVMIFNKNKPEQRKGKILFINASEEYEQHPNVRKLHRLGVKNIEKIVKAYRDFKDEEGFSRAVSLDEIKENDYNLNVTLYVFPIEEIEEIDIGKEWKELQSIEDNLKDLDEKIIGYLKELKYFGG